MSTLLTMYQVALLTLKYILLLPTFIRVREVIKASGV